MKTMQADYKTDIAMLGQQMADFRTEMAKRDAARDAEAAKRDAEAARWNAEAAKRDAERDAEAAKRDKDNLRWSVGLWVATVVVLGILVRWPA